MSGYSLQKNCVDSAQLESLYGHRTETTIYTFGGQREEGLLDRNMTCSYIYTL